MLTDACVNPFYRCRIQQSEAATPRYARTLASSKFMTLGFRDLGLHAINTWVVDHNPSLRIIERLGFRFIGRQRQCHYIDGQLYDRLLFDLLASEPRELDEERWRRIGTSHRGAVCRERLVQPGGRQWTCRRRRRRCACCRMAFTF